MVFDEGELEGDVCPGGGVGGVVEGGPLRVEGGSHVDSVEPHLIYVGDFAVPETTGGGAWVRV